MLTFQEEIAILEAKPNSTKINTITLKILKSVFEEKKESRPKTLIESKHKYNSPAVNILFNDKEPNED